MPPVPGAVFYLATLRYQGGFAFLTRDSSGFAPLEFHHRTLIALDEAGAVAWASSVGDDLSALDTTINGALVEGSRLQPPLDEMLGRRLAVALDTTINGALVEGSPSRLQPPIDEILGRRLAVALEEDSEGSTRIRTNNREGEDRR